MTAASPGDCQVSSTQARQSRNSGASRHYFGALRFARHERWAIRYRLRLPGAQ